MAMFINLVGNTPSTHVKKKIKFLFLNVNYKSNQKNEQKTPEQYLLNEAPKTEDLAAESSVGSH